MPRSDIRQKKYVAIDIGTSRTRIYIDGIGMIFNQATLIAVDYKSGRIIALGDEARKFSGKLSGALQVKQLIKRGVITDMKMLRVFLSAILKKHEELIKGSVVTLACPVSVTNLERDSLVKSIKDLGVYHVQVEDDAKLALLGAGIDIKRPDGYIGLDLGHGKTTVASVAIGETINSKWTKVAGSFIDNEIIKLVKTRYTMLIGEITAESVKITVSSLSKTKTPLKISTYGYDLNSSMPKHQEITNDDITKLLVSTFTTIANTVTALLEETPKELAGDIIKNGIVITGGLANIPGVQIYFENFFEIPVKVAKNASTAVIDGAIAYKEYTFQAIEALRNKDSDLLF